MMDRIVVGVLGAAIAIDVGALDTPSQSRVCAFWANELLPASAPSSQTVVASPQGDVDPSLTQLRYAVTRAAMDARRGEVWLLRGIGLADSHGRVAVIVAPDGLAQTLAASGSFDGYVKVGAEILAIDREGGVVIDRAARTDVAAMRLSKIVILGENDLGFGGRSAEQLSVESALELLVPQSIHLLDWNSPLRSMRAVLAATGGAVRVKLGDPHMLAAVLRDLSDESPADHTNRRPVSGDRRAGALPQDAEPLIFRKAVVDSVVTPDGRALLLHRQTGLARLSSLGRLASAIWNAADGVGAEQLLASANAETAFAEAPRHAAVDLLASMRASGILCNEPSWRLADDVAWDAGVGRTAVLSLTSVNALPLILEASSHVIWSTIADSGPLPQSEIIGLVASYFGIEPEVIKADVDLLLKGLGQRGVITQV